MKKFRIKPDINNGIQVWTLEIRKWTRWERIFRNEDIHVVRRMKDHLLKHKEIYTRKNNVPEHPIRTNSKWMKQKEQIKRKDLPESLKDMPNE